MRGCGEEGGTVAGAGASTSSTSSTATRSKLPRVLAALLFVHSAIAVYSLLVKSATNDGVDPGLFVLIRDCNTVSACVHVSVHNPRHAVLVPR